MTLWTNAKEKRGSSRILSFLWQELQNDYRTLIGVESGKSDVKIPSKNSAEEQNND